MSSRAWGTDTPSGRRSWPCATDSSHAALQLKVAYVVCCFVLDMSSLTVASGVVACLASKSRTRRDCLDSFVDGPWQPNDSRGPSSLHRTLRETRRRHVMVGSLVEGHVGCMIFWHPSTIIHRVLLAHDRVNVVGGLDIRKRNGIDMIFISPIV